ncbi:MAG: iron ABC transporter permease [Bifidobacteriaceae bacterium]|jgi:iron complex transport system permease protein|nr:iron ABC transporter permease [Bifidobacteriaceae bacterium]
MTALITPNSSASRRAEGPKAAQRRRAARRRWALVGLAAALGVAFLVALSVGRYSVPLNEAARILAAQGLEITGLDSWFDLRRTWTDQEQTVITLVRLPRSLMAVLAGGALAVSGAALQALFRNPLVSPDVIGVSSASSFGGVLAIALGGGGLILMGGAFALGLAAAALVMAMGRIRASSPILTIVLGGIVVSAFFNALVSLVTYLADPYTTLPSITFWLMGSLAAATWTKLWLAAVPIAIGLTVVMALRWRIDVLSLGDEDSRALGLNPTRLRWVLIVAVSMMTAATVASSGVIGWVGLVIPHLVRLMLGPDHRTLIPASFLLGGTYLLVVDLLSRSMTASEVPVGILTAILGAPFFVYLLITQTRKDPDHA